MHIAKWTVLLAIFWLLLSGIIEPLMLFFGVASVIIVLIALVRMDAVDKEPKAIGTGIPFLRYIPWLIGQITLSSLEVTKMVWGAPEKVSPTLATLDASDVPEDCRALYANSITLTPGTLSVDLEDGDVTVHALRQTSIDELKEGHMKNKIIRIWGSNS
ncbi:cation transporter [Arenicella chitinivorans]|uniref:Cation transporter n=1 Tax=Arenicella chitinivorans TaxID=1329800 RepID=A0A918VPN9_9GAMM|nr:Na+/H+ antiporter subunit E [Arenicella chitinivorans]GHA17671.1 cation transporter [Arenicella chitinivorans]